MASLGHGEKIVVNQQGAVGVYIVWLRTGVFTLYLGPVQELIIEQQCSGQNLIAALNVSYLGKASP